MSNEREIIDGGDIKNALLQGGSPATMADLRQQFEIFLTDRNKGKNVSKPRFVSE